MKESILRHLKAIIYILLPLTGGGWVGVSCSEETEEDTEYANWQERNEAYFASLEQQYAASTDGSWLKFKSYDKNPSASVGTYTDYIYAQVIESGAGTDSPMYTDSVRVSYRGRLIPSESYPEGYIFDSTAYGDYNPKTNATVKFAVSALVNGFSTALLHMHRGDTWRVFIPYTLGYGTTSSGSIPAYSNLIFELSLIDFQEAGHAMEPYSARSIR